MKHKTLLVNLISLVVIAATAYTLPGWISAQHADQWYLNRSEKHRKVERSDHRIAHTTTATFRHHAPGNVSRRGLSR